MTVTGRAELAAFDARDIAAPRFVLRRVDRGNSQPGSGSSYLDLQSAGWAETTIVSGDLTDAVTRVKEEQTSGYLLAQRRRPLRPMAGRGGLDR